MLVCVGVVQNASFFDSFEYRDCKQSNWLARKTIPQPHVRIWQGLPNYYLKNYVLQTTQSA